MQDNSRTSIVHLLGRQILCALSMVLATVLALNKIEITIQLIVLFAGPSGIYFYIRHLKDTFIAGKDK